MTTIVSILTVNYTHAHARDELYFYKKFSEDLNLGELSHHVLEHVRANYIYKQLTGSGFLCIKPLKARRLARWSHPSRFNSISEIDSTSEKCLYQ